MDPIHAPREELVRRKAYELYELKGKTEGHAVEDWVEAESKIERE
jgi:YHS domain-containing protein